jgi:hypothetical protein
MTYEKRAQQMPGWVQGQFLPLWRKWLKEYDETGRFSGSETGEKPTKFAMWAMGMEQSEIDYYYPTQKHSFITVRLNNETPLEEIKNKLQNIKFKWMAVASARLEIFSTNMTKNHHVHILSTWVIKTRAIRDLSRYFKVPKENVDVKHGEDCQLYDKRSNYINGIKKELKSEAIDADTKYLDELNIPQVYQIENI